MTEDDFIIKLLEKEREISKHEVACGCDCCDDRPEMFCLLLDRIGVPKDSTFNLSQKELREGECDHGIGYYCRDWCYEWLSTKRSAKGFLKECRRHAKQYASHWCPRCQSGEQSFSKQREMAIMMEQYSRGGLN